MTRDQLEELAKRLDWLLVDPPTDERWAWHAREYVQEAAALLRSLLAQEPVAWISPDRKLRVMADEKPLWPDATIPLYAAPVPAVDVEWKAEAMRLADKYALRTAEDFRDDSYRAGGFQDQARAALAAHLDKIGQR